MWIATGDQSVIADSLLSIVLAVAFLGGMASAVADGRAEKYRHGG